MDEGDLSSDEPRCEGVTQIVHSEILDVCQVAGGAEASADVIEFSAVLPTKHPVGFWAVPVSKQPAGHKYIVGSMINRDDSALAIFCVVAFKGESPGLEVDA